MSVINYIKKIRLEKHIHQKDLARYLELSTDELFKIENSQ